MATITTEFMEAVLAIGLDDLKPSLIAAEIDEFCQQLFFLTIEVSLGVQKFFRPLT
jgi:hypothetical protein